MTFTNGAIIAHALQSGVSSCCLVSSNMKRLPTLGWIIKIRGKCLNFPPTDIKLTTWNRQTDGQMDRHQTDAWRC